MGYTNIRDTMKLWDPNNQRNSNIVRLKKLMNITINLVKDGHQVLNSFLAQILPPLQHYKSTSQIIPSSNIIYLKPMSITYQEVLLLALQKNTVNITSCHISPSQQIMSHGIMHHQIEKGLMFGSSKLAKNNQQQSNKFQNYYQINN